ncbi:MAG: MFS transporter [Candidatus Pacebacteria bacterium]|nr:MFS transporter [Candidatus Paceibacterota bacterium]
MYSFLKRFKQSNRLPVVYVANLFLAFHYFLVLYIHSSFLSEYISEKAVGLLYTVGSVINLLFLLNVPKIINRFGTYQLALAAIALEIFSIIAFALSDTPFVILLSTLIFLTVIPLIIFSLDMFVEKYAISENETGKTRSFFLTLSNISLVIAPAVVSVLTKQGSFRAVYMLSAFFLIMAFGIVLRGLKGFKDARFSNAPIVTNVLRFFKQARLRNVFFANLILHIFYSWMVIYVPLYLFHEIGFDWPTIGIMFTIMLLPFVLFELPLGIIADTRLGEKEIMATGFIITAIATAAISIPTTQNFFLWTSILFLTRTGASFIEVMTETYFFKFVNNSNSDAIGIFRLTRPISYIIGTLAATVALSFINYRFIFIGLAIIVLLGLYPTWKLKDTR